MNNLPFNIARETANNFDKSFQKVRDVSTLDNILNEVSNTQDKGLINNTIGRILSEVSPERQGMALQYLQNRLGLIDEQRQRQALINEGINPDLPSNIQGLQYKNKVQSQNPKPNLKLTESLNQAQKRYKDKIASIKTPFEKRDAYGSIFLDFEADDRKRKDVLGKLDREFNNYISELKRTYKNYGMEVPQDIEDQLKEQIQVNSNGQIISMKLQEQIDDFERKYPASKYDGRKATDDEGNIFISENGHWRLVEK